MRAFEARGLAREYRSKQLMKDVHLSIEERAKDGYFSIEFGYFLEDKGMVDIIEEEIKKDGYETIVEITDIQAKITIKW